ncbi:hypothetical protein PIB30_010819 [Stylosanthes scabra]|uniref:Uncharacterized protein n=1 Tax=Stylosanthes scabra TaxID=79078 RepID=A0ABU6Q6N3_9FABA|nr:hypothetical protein [Stylosanthes scabra]
MNGRSDMNCTTSESAGQPLHDRSLSSRICCCQDRCLSMLFLGPTRLQFFRRRSSWSSPPLCRSVVASFSAYGSISLLWRGSVFVAPSLLLRLLLL